MTRKTLKLGVQTLEAREVPATAVLSGGVLSVTGTDSSETITVRQTTTAIKVAGITTSFALASVKEIRVDARGGNDTVNLQKSGAVVTKPAVLWGGSGKDTLKGGNGSDLIDGGSEADTVFGFKGNDRLAGDAGSDVINGGDGADNLAGGDGQDNLVGGPNADRFDGGHDGDDYVDVAAGEHVHDDLFGNNIFGVGYVHHHILGFNDPSEFGWYDAAMPDPTLRRLARTADRDDSISRPEMIEILQAAAPGGVTANEFDSLKQFTSNAKVAMPDLVRNLSTKLVHGDPANAWFTAGKATRVSLGNLAAGTTETNMGRLIGKWFLGTDLPLAKNFERTERFEYAPTNGFLFFGEPSSKDLNQGTLGDCYFLAGLGAVADRTPSRIRDMFIPNGDGTVTVRFFKDKKPEFVTVNMMLPAKDGALVFAGEGSATVTAGKSLWVPLAEKAYAQLNESGWIGQDGTNSYNGLGGQVPDLPIIGVKNLDGLNGGASDTAMGQIAGTDTSVWVPALTSFADIVKEFSTRKKAVVFGSHAFTSEDIIKNHAFVMVGFDTVKKTVTLRNPHDASTQKLKWTDVQLNFDNVYYGHV